MSYFKSFEKREIFEVLQNVHVFTISLTLGNFAKRVHEIESLKVYHSKEEELVQLTQLSLASLV